MLIVVPPYFILASKLVSMKCDMMPCVVASLTSLPAIKDYQLTVFLTARNQYLLGKYQRQVYLILPKISRM